MTPTYPIRPAEQARRRRAFPTYVSQTIPEVYGVASNSTPHLRLMVQLVDALDRQRKRGDVLNAPPHGLTTAVCFDLQAAWRLGRHPEISIELWFKDPVSAAQCAQRVNHIVHADNYGKIFPRMRLAKATDASGDVRTTLGGGVSFRTLGETACTPQPGLVVFDTPQGALDIATQAARDRSFRPFESAHDRLTAGGSIFVATPRMHWDDWSGRLADRDYVLWPAPLIADRRLEYLFGDRGGPKRTAGSALDPVAWPKERIAFLQLTLSAETFAACFQQEPLTPAS